MSTQEERNAMRDESRKALLEWEDWAVRSDFKNLIYFLAGTKNPHEKETYEEYKKRTANNPEPLLSSYDKLMQFRIFHATTKGAG